MFNKAKNKKRKTGFTLVEILVVILIIGLLFIMLVPRLSSMDEASRQSGVKNKFKEFQNAATTVMLENAGLTKVMSSSTDVAGLIKALNKELDDANKFDSNTIQGQYCDSLAVDPWNNHYRLHVNGNTITFISYGSNPVAVHAAEFDYDAENCKYISEVAYVNGEVFINTRGFTVNIEEVNETGNAGEPSIAATPEDCFTWDGTTITGLSRTCGHTAEEHANIVIPGKCTAIGYRAFYNCTKLTSITIPNSVTSIGTSALEKCTSLTDVTIHNGVTSLSGRLFDGCKSLESITIPNSVTSIGNGTFSNCTKLTSIIIPDSVTSIGASAFLGCVKLTSITIPNGITHITTGAFSNCSSLTSVTIPNSVTSIDNNAFNSCGKLESITIPDSVTSIGAYAFQYSGLTSITIPNSITSISTGTFSQCTRLRSVTIPNSVTSIGTGAFTGCSRLTSLTVPDSVTMIGDIAFKRVPHVEYHGTASGAPWGAASMN